MKKYYKIQFENENTEAIDAFEALYEAVKHCELLIFSKYDIRLQRPVVIDEKYIVIEITIPDSKADSFSVGRCLRSISDYLTHKRGFSCKNNCRLIKYIEIPKPYNVNIGKHLNNSEQLTLLSQIIELLKSENTIDKEKTERIKAILEE